MNKFLFTFKTIKHFIFYFNSKKRKIKETLEKIAHQNFNFIETNSFTRLKNNFNEDYNKIKMDSLSKREIQVLKLFINVPPPDAV